jgi:cleavage stimulation factor subunit 3
MEERVTNNPFDAEAWEVLLEEAQQRTSAEYRPLFEKCLRHFPTAVICWYRWVNTELDRRNLEDAEALFERCLPRCPHIDLWGLYIHYLKLEKRCNAKELETAYTVLLDTVGADVGSGPFWVEYVQLLSQGVTGGGPPQSSAVTKAREAFHRALLQPATGLDHLWKEYEAWETAHNPDHAKGILAEIADDVLVARRVAQERRALAQNVGMGMHQMPMVLSGVPKQVSIRSHEPHGFDYAKESKSTLLDCCLC